MISSRVQIQVEIVAVPFSIKVWALPSHTSVPWDKPEIRIRSVNSCGFASRSIPMAKSVPNSGIPSVPIGQPFNSSGVTPRAEVFLKSDMTVLSSSGISCACSRSDLPTYESWSDHRVQGYPVSKVMVDGMVIKVGCDCCRCHIICRVLHRRKCINLHPTGTTMIPPGCCPVVPSHAHTTVWQYGRSHKFACVCHVLHK